MTKERSLKIAIAFVWALGVLILIGVGFKLLNDYVLAPQESGPLHMPQVSHKKERREVKVFFSDPDASKLVYEKRFAELGAGVASDAVVLVSELIKGPQLEGSFPTIPSETRLLNAYMIGTVLVLDFTQEIQVNHGGGTANEMLTVYSIVNTAVANLNGIERVQILVEGKDVETLAGHLDLSKPLMPNVKWMSALQLNVVGYPGNIMEAGEIGTAHSFRGLLSMTAKRFRAKSNESV